MVISRDKMEHGLDYLEPSSYYAVRSGNRIVKKCKTFRAARSFAAEYLMKPATKVRKLYITDDGNSWGSIMTVGEVVTDPVLNHEQFRGICFITADDSDVMFLNTDGSFYSKMYVRKNGRYTLIATPKRFLKL